MNKVKEAEALAKGFALDMTPVHIARVQTYLEDKGQLQCIFEELDKITVS